MVFSEDSCESLGLQGDPASPILREISPECSLEGLMWKLKLQILWPPDLEIPCCWERLKVGGEVDERG